MTNALTDGLRRWANPRLPPIAAVFPDVAYPAVQPPSMNSVVPVM
jgi:hypothetical protein